MGDRLHVVSKGGLFHVPKVKYSAETEAFIRELIRESKLSIFQRKEVEKSVKNGEPLPLPPKKTALSSKKKLVPLEDLKVKYMIPRRRKLNKIQQSGAFERDPFVPSYAKANHEIEKQKLQEVMAFGRTLKSGKHRKKALNDDEISSSDETKDTEGPSRETVLGEIMDGIEDRRKFLKEMDAAGRGSEYKNIIEQEIAGQFRLINEVNEMFDKIDIHKEDEDEQSYV